MRGRCHRHPAGAIASRCLQALYRLLLMVAQPLGLGLMGGVAGWLGARAALLVGAILLGGLAVATLVDPALAEQRARRTAPAGRQTRTTSLGPVGHMWRGLRRANGTLRRGCCHCFQAAFQTGCERTQPQEDHHALPHRSPQSR
jgi:hypothetical protein